MSNRIKGLHHITAIAGNAQRNYDFYTKTLGLRLVKKTVNFDDPGTYHFYFGNEKGEPGTILTFFPWQHIKRGRAGTGMATHIDYSVPAGSLAFWMERLKEGGVKQEPGIMEKFSQPYISFEDPDGLLINLVENDQDNRIPWTTPGIDSNAALRGFHGVTLTLDHIKPTAEILTDIFEYRFVKQENNVHRFVTDAADNAAIIDLVEDPESPHGIVAGGTNHHVAFRVTDNEMLMQFREKIISKGLGITPQIDRNYFFSLYFREPGGVLFEIATDTPGFDVDEPLTELGTGLKLPPQYEPARQKIAAALPVIIP